MAVKKDTSFIVVIMGLNMLAILIMYWGLKAGVPDFSAYDAGAERKGAFFNYFLPLINEQNAEILGTREQLVAWNEDRESLAWWNAWEIELLADDYGMDNFDMESDAHWDTLLRRVDVVPPSLALVQAANESSWGTSRFAREGNNFYGEWCYVPGCGIVPKKRGKKERHEVADFDSPANSVASYMNNLNYHPAYKTLREIRAGLRAGDDPISGIALAEGLHSYSERGEEYIKELRSMITFNSLSQHDEEN